MNEQFIRDRITQLRLCKNLSEYQLSMELGRSRGYINNISSGKTLPSMSEFLNICAYFQITPAEFFDYTNERPDLSHEMLFLFNKLNTTDQTLLLHVTRRLLGKPKE